MVFNLYSKKKMLISVKKTKTVWAPSAYSNKACRIMLGFAMYSK